MKNFSYITFVLLLGFGIQSCEKDTPQIAPSQRYADEVFTSVSKITLVYSDTFGFEMDIYSPDGDTETNRPVVILAHGGGFFTGSKDNPGMVRLAENLAKRGYVAASINYHLANGFNDVLDSVKAASLVMKAIGDGRSAIRYMRKSAANGNPFDVDPDNIFIGGNSAGAILALHVAYLDEQDVLNAYTDSIQNANGGFNGLSGNNGYSSSVKGVINMAGGLISLNFIDNNDPPLVSFHGVDDDVVPANCGDVYSGATGGLDVINVCGSIPIHSVATSNALSSDLFTYPGEHVPWMDSSTGETLALFDEVEQKCFEFLYENL